jgi:hypothetical protein
MSTPSSAPSRKGGFFPSYFRDSLGEEPRSSQEETVLVFDLNGYESGNAANRELKFLFEVFSYYSLLSVPIPNPFSGNTYYLSHCMKHCTSVT